MPTGFTQKALAEKRNELKAREIQQRPRQNSIYYNWPTDKAELPDLSDKADWCIK